MASQYLTLYKIIVLYMLKRSDVELSKSQIYDFILGNEYTTFMTLQEAFGELSDQKLINEHKKRNRTFLELTEAGEEALHFFIGQMNPEIRLQIDAYLKENKIKLRNESSIIADYNKRADGQYVARLVVKEMGEDLINIELTVPTESMADSVCARWHDKSSSIYSYITDQLLNDAD
ncbi:DUF4364 family protein [Butyrivibrio fibrisolvens]|uniref:DUF4364 domain-containing protein n=1 Tax=Butyrivibrio fibrisolvens TaxID=831 RepID=A0A1H9W1J6_BUTFI|nr:DUF4364 family protein [Butyrivibrio fibrisolvens]SES27792.1 protein of unknown function [Butyrivibrio fibrisolvens]